MPAVSGSPTQLAASVTTLANLGGLPDDAYKDGDFAYVQSTRATYQLDRTSAATPSSVAVDTFSGNGQWVFFQASSSWGSQATWYIDPATGDDENDGETTGTALATWAEFCRRASTMAVSMTVTIVSNIAERLVGGFSSSVPLDLYLLITGAPTVVAYSALSPAATVTYVDPVASPSARGTVSCSSLLDATGAVIASGFDNFSNYFIRATGEYVAPILTSSAGVAQVPFFYRKTLSATKPANDTPLEVLQLPTTPCLQIVGRGVIPHAQYLKFTTAGGTNDQTFIDWHGTLGNAGNDVGTYFACEFARHVAFYQDDFALSCLFTGTGSVYVNGGSVIFSGGGHKRNLTHALGGVISFDGHIFQASRLIVGQSADFVGGSRVEAYGTKGLGIFDCTGGSAITMVGAASLGARTLYGTNPANGAYGLNVGQGAQVQIHTASTPTITGQTNAIFFNGAATAIPPLTATAVVPAASALATWADWTAAPFSRNVVSYTNGSKICGT